MIERAARYQVLEKTFVNGVMYEKGDIIEAADGLSGAALKRIGDGQATAQPASRAGGADRAGELQRLLDEERAARKAADDAHAEAMRLLEKERAENKSAIEAAQARIDDLASKVTDKAAGGKAGKA